MTKNLSCSFGEITAKNRMSVITNPKEEDDTVMNDFVSYMDNVFAEINKTDKRKNFFKLLFL